MRVPRAPAYGAPAAPAYGEPVPPGYVAPPGYGAPLPPDDPRWWERGWWSEAFVALAALAAGFIVGLLVGESSASKNVTTGAGPTPVRTVTVKGPTHTTTVTHVVVHTHTVTAATPSESTGGEGSAGSGGAGKTYTGSGNSRVGTITIARQSTIHWRSGGGFSIQNSAEDEHSLAFSSGSSSGESPVEPGTYHQVTVNAPGGWSMTISPG